MFTRRSLLVSIPFVFAAVACGGHHRPWAAQPVIAGGIQIQVNQAYNDGHRLYVRAVVMNNGPVPIMVNRDAVVVVLPNGQAIPRSSGSTSTHIIYTILPGQAHDAHVDFLAQGFGWDHVPGAQVVWSNAVTVNGQPIQLPPTMLAGQ